LVLTHAEAFGAAAVAHRCALRGLDAPLLRLSSATARALTRPNDDDAATPTSTCYAMDETLSQAAASLGLDLSGGDDDDDKDYWISRGPMHLTAAYKAAAATYGALSEAQWSTALAAHAAHAPGAALVAAGVATALSIDEAVSERCYVRAMSCDEFPEALRAAARGAPPASPLAALLRAPHAYADGSLEALLRRCAWLCRLEALLALAAADKGRSGA
jgi:hypothetical protein